MVMKNSAQPLTLDYAPAFKIHGMGNSQQKTLTIGRIAEQADVGIDTIRFYERRGLLPEPARTASGYRLYTTDTVRRLDFIRRAKDLGFTLEEIIALLGLQDTAGSKAAVKKLTRRKLEQIDSKMQDLTRMREVLSALEHDCAGTGDVRTCPIIEALSDGTNFADAATNTKKKPS
jgi:MerR family copper efflux transcriptional regulator